MLRLVGVSPFASVPKYGVLWRNDLRRSLSLTKVSHSLAPYSFFCLRCCSGVGLF